ncbi:TnsD family Tn7-like transposition protein [Enterobacter sp. P82]|uniref:TnsD family Tn7-like transposition protein n=1 Tax=Enterobacter sp. P82 TaxID=3123033 RepID=UPI003FA58555
MWLPSCLPDELLISRMIRFVTLYGWTGLHQLYQILGSEKKSIHPTMTSGLSSLAFSPHDSAQKLLFQQTLAPVYMYFLSGHNTVIQKAMLSGNSSGTLRACQFPVSGSGSSIVLKSCPLCAVRDICQYGVAYWHRIHQIPGVSVCPDHAIILNIFRFSERQRLIPGFLPDIRVRYSESSGIDSQYAQYCRDVLYLASESRLYIDPVTLYKKRLQTIGYMTEGGRIRHRYLMRSFYHDMLFSKYSLVHLLPSSSEDYGYLYHLLNNDFRVHPVRHLLFSFWLFREGDAIYHTQLKESFLYRDITPDFDKDDRDDRLNDIVTLLKSGVSLNRINNLTGRSRCYIKNIAAAMNIDIVSRPRKITNEIRKKIIALAEAGFHRKAIARQCGVCSGSVEQIISSCSGLVQRRKCYHYQSAFRRCKYCILRYRQNHPCSTRKEIKAACNAEFFWLYNHKRDVLEDILPAATRPVGKPRI